MTRERSTAEDAAIWAGESEVRRWGLRRRLAIEAVALVVAALYAVLLLGRDGGPGAASWAFLLLVVLVRAGGWRWGDRGARTEGARVDFALRHHRLAGWTAADLVMARARQRLRLARLLRVVWSSVIGVSVVLVVVTLVADPPSPRHAVAAGALLVGAGVLLLLHERGLAEARRWTADPPA